MTPSTTHSKWSERIHVDLLAVLGNIINMLSVVEIRYARLQDFDRTDTRQKKSSSSDVSHFGS